jgi:hypothetical protein
MRKSILVALSFALSAPALAATYPVSGRYGVTATSEKGPIDCGKLRVIAFNGDQRTDTGGGVSAYRNISVSNAGADFRVVDTFINGKISNAHVIFVLRKVDADRVELNMQPGGLIKLHRCK